MNTNLSFALKKHFAEKREPQYLIEKKLGFAAATLSKIVMGLLKGTPVQRQALADYLGYKVEDLFEDEKEAVNN